jgi:hypothetical protein
MDDVALRATRRSVAVVHARETQVIPIVCDPARNSGAAVGRAAFEALLPSAWPRHSNPVQCPQCRGNSPP